MVLFGDLRASIVGPKQIRKSGLGRHCEPSTQAAGIPGFVWVISMKSYSVMRKMGACLDHKSAWTDSGMRWRIAL